MSFAVWKSKPPFEFAEGDAEQVYVVGNVWVVTDDPAKATQAEVDAALAPKVLSTLDKLEAAGVTLDEVSKLLK